MKTRLSRRTSGFTLVELLVVIAIIAVLASAGFAAGLAALNKAKRTRSLAVATAIEQAVNNFYTEYGFLPTTGDSDRDLATDAAEGRDMIVVLMGKEPTSGTPMNAKGINYLSINEGKKAGNKGRDGMIFDTAGNPLGIYDPWGGPYRVRLDLDFDEKLTVRPKGSTQERILNGKRVAVWSDGADGAGTANGKTNDDVTTW